MCRTIVETRVSDLGTRVESGVPGRSQCERACGVKERVANGYNRRAVGGSQVSCARNISLSFSPPLSSSSHSTPLASLPISLRKTSTGFGAEIVATFDKLQDVSKPSTEAPHRWTFLKFACWVIRVVGRVRFLRCAAMILSRYIV